MNGATTVSLDRWLIVAKRHIHMTPEDALAKQCTNGQIVQSKSTRHATIDF